ncbi:unnamed protein product [Allacma fusca]|uniref:Uncharacterized protein n=1 Tax=Allacma fusca TaxID=39272 RepID=A0A8J2K0L1_9HEXA|nr:unnamed protein product [Allacma fusca]
MSYCSKKVNANSGIPSRKVKKAIAIAWRKCLLLDENITFPYNFLHKLKPAVVQNQSDESMRPRAGRPMTNSRTNNLEDKRRNAPNESSLAKLSLLRKPVSVELTTIIVSGNNSSNNCGRGSKTSSLSILLHDLLGFTIKIPM